MTLAPRSVLVLAVSAAVAAAAPAAASPPGTSVLLDRPDGFGAALSGAGADSTLGSPDAVSGNGRFVAFTSAADGLSPADDDAVVNVYRKDRATGAVVLVSVATGGTPSHGDAGEPQISDDGNRIAFVGEDPALDPAAAGTAGNVYVRDVAAGTTTLASRASGAAGVPVEAGQPAISGDGATVAFVTAAALEHDPNTVGDVYARRLSTGKTELISRSSGAAGTAGTAGAFDPTVDADGTDIAFATLSALHPEDKNGRVDVYRRTLPPATDVPYTDLISVRDSVFAGGNGDSFAPSISADGASVAYRTTASDLDAQQTDADGSAADVLIFTGASQVTLSAGLLSGSPIADNPHVGGSPAALKVAFDVSVLSKDGTRQTQVAVADVSSREHRIVSTGPGGAPGDGDSLRPAISGDGAVVAFDTRAGNLGGALGGDHADVAARVLATGATAMVSAPAAGPLPEDLQHAYVRAGAGALTPDGRFGVFEAGHDGLGVADRNVHVFRRDQISGRTLLVDRADGPAGAISSEAWSPSQSADGRIVAFVTASALSAADQNGRADVYVRDLAAGTTQLVSRTPSGSAGNGESELPAVSADGRHVAFETAAADLGDGDTDATFDIHVLELATGTMTWVSRGTGPGGGDAYQAAIDADGSVVAFTSEATNLDPADKDTEADVYVRDLAAGTTRLASRRTNGTKAAARSESASVSADGRIVAFASDADLDGQPEAVSDVFVHDRVAGTTVLASRASGAGGAEGDGPSDDPAVSADGRAVAFATAAANLGGAPGVKIRRLDDLTTTAAGRGSTSALSADGSCVLLTSRAPEITRSSPDHARAVLRAVRPACQVTTGVSVPGRPGGPGAGPAGQTGAPVVSRLSLSRSRFTVGRARTARSARVRSGTVVRFSLDRPATVKLTVQRRAGGRWVRAGVLRRSAEAGRSRVRFSGRIGRRALRQGRHRIVARAVDAAGRTSAPRRVAFRIARAR